MTKAILMNEKMDKHLYPFISSVKAKLKNGLGAGGQAGGRTRLEPHRKILEGV